MKKTAFIILISLSMIALFVKFLVNPLVQALGYQQRAGVQITSLPEALVSINGNEVGNTPYQDENLKPGEYKVKLSTEKAVWEGWIKLINGTLTVVNRELAETIASSSGEILTLKEGKGVMVISTPEGAEVSVDGKVYGKTPLTISSLPEGEHNFLISHSNFLKRSIQAHVPENLSLSLSVDLAVSQIDLETPPTKITSQEVTVKSTPTGFLRVRDKPNLAGKEIAKVSTGETLTLLQEVSGWKKVRLQDGQEGYVSAPYVSSP